MKNLKEYTTDELTNELLKRGFAVNNLWQIADVDNHIEQYIENYDGVGKEALEALSDEDKLGILNDAAFGDGANIAINDTLADIIYSLANND